jgi:hypothetical protein
MAVVSLSSFVFHHFFQIYPYFYLNCTPILFNIVADILAIIFTIKWEFVMVRRLKNLWHQILERSRPSDHHKKYPPNTSKPLKHQSRKAKKKELMSPITERKICKKIMSPCP